MILLSGHSLTPVRTVPLESMSLDLKERDSTASMVPADMSGISIGSWLLDDTKPGANIVWRVKGIRTAYATDTPTVELEHVISTLRDMAMFGEVTPEKISGTGGATKCTAKQAVQYILKQQSDWKLGTFDYNVSQAYKFDGDTLWDALQTVSDTLEDCWWSFDLTTYPFKLNIKKGTAGVACELRPGRNLATVTKSIDTSGMYTRFYPIGKDDLHISGNYVEKNTKTYGVICKIETDTSKETAEELKNWANQRLAKHAVPKVSITAEGTELADATGESLDRLTLGRICRIPLEEFGTVIEERIVELRYADKVKEPEKVTVTLANSQEDVATIIAQSIREGAAPGGKAARSGARSSKEDHAWIEDTSDHVALCAVGIIGTDAKGNPNWVRLSRLEVNENGIYGEVKSVQNDVEIASTRIDQNEDAITMEANRRIAEDKDLAGRIKVEADKVGMVVEVKKGKNVIRAGQICVAINESGETKATIEADKIHLLGETIAQTITANYISSKIASLSVLRAKAISCTGAVVSTDGYVMAPSIYMGVSGNAKNMASSIWALKIKGPKDGVYTLQKIDYNDEDWVDVGTFSRAIASWTMGWSDGTFTAKANPQNQSASTTIVQGTASWDGTTVTIPIEAYDSDNPEYQYATGRNVTATYSGPDYSYTKTMTCTGKSFSSGTWVYTMRYSVNNSELWTVGNSYTFHHNSGYT